MEEEEVTRVSVWYEQGDKDELVWPELKSGQEEGGSGLMEGCERGQRGLARDERITAWHFSTRANGWRQRSSTMD